MLAGWVTTEIGPPALGGLRPDAHRRRGHPGGDRRRGRDLARGLRDRLRADLPGRRLLHGAAGAATGRSRRSRRRRATGQRVGRARRGRSRRPMRRSSPRSERRWPSSALDLTVAWAGIIVLAVVMYVLLDGFDLGVGILFPFAPSDEDRDLMMTSVAPIWDGNETWLVLGGAGAVRRLPAGLRGDPLGHLPAAPDHADRADPARRRVRVPLQGGPRAATSGTRRSTTARCSRPSPRAWCSAPSSRASRSRAATSRAACSTGCTPFALLTGRRAGRGLRAARRHLADLEAPRARCRPGRAAGAAAPARGARRSSAWSASGRRCSTPAIAARWFSWPNLALPLAGAAGHRARRLRPLPRGRAAARACCRSC